VKPLLAAWLVAISVVCAADPCGTPILDWPAGPINVAFTDGDRVFFGAGLALVTAEQNPDGGLTTLGHTRPMAWPANDVFVVGNHALVGADRSVGVLDIGSPGLPIEVGTISVSSKVSRIRADSGVAVSHWVAGYAGGGQGIEIIDYSDPTNPVIVSTIEVGSGLTSIEMVPGWLFVLKTHVLSVYDLSNPVNPVLSAEVQDDSWVSLLTATRDTLVVGAHTGLVFLDVTVPTTPQEVADYEPHDWPEQAVWTQETLLLANDSFFEVVDVSSSTPTRMALLEGIFVNGFRAMTAAEGFCLVVDGDYDYHDLCVIDLSDPTSPTPGPLIPRPANVRDIAWAPNRVAAITDRALWLVDFNPAGDQSTQLAAQFQDKPAQVDLKDNLAFVGLHRNYLETFDYRLQVLDVSDPSGAQVISEIDLESDQEETPWWSVQVDGSDWIAVSFHADNVSRLELVDVSDPANPIRGVSLPLDRPSSHASVGGDLLFLSMVDDLVVIDVSAPLQPRKVGVLNIDRLILGLGTWGRYTFPLVENDLLAVDAGRATEPTLIGGSYSSGRYPMTAAAAGRAFVFNGDPLGILGDAGLTVFDVTTPQSPNAVATVEDIPGLTHSSWWVGMETSFEGELVVLGGGSFGVQALDMAECGNPQTVPAANFAVSPPSPVTSETIRFSNHSTGEPTEWTWSFGDGTSSNQAEPQHVYSDPGTYTIELTANNSHGSSSSVLDLQVADASAPPIADFRWFDDEPSMLVPVQFVDASSGRPRSWSWDFGDGFRSSETHPTHLYSLPGSYEVTLEVSNIAGVDTTTMLLSIEPFTYLYLGHDDQESLIPAAAATPGLHETVWQTDLVLHNPTDDQDFVRVFFLDRDKQDNTQSLGTLVNLHPGQTVVVEDVVTSLFSLDEVAGALWIENTWQNLATSRTYTSRPDGGSYGQAVPSIKRNTGICDPTTQVLIGLQQDDSFRTNIGVLNSAGWNDTVTVNVFGPDGDFVDDVTIELGPFGVHQISNLLDKVSEGETDHGYAVLDTCHWIKAYASVIDNQTGDAVYLPAQIVDPDAGTNRWVVPAVASIDGAYGTQWRSVLELFNPEDAPAMVTLTLLESGGQTTPPRQRVLRVESGQVLRVDDVVEGLFGVRTIGALILECTSALHSTSRTFTANPQAITSEGTFGQHVPTIPSSELLTEENPSRLLNLCEDANVRSNVGFVNPTPDPAVVEITALSPTGSPQSTITISLDPWEHRQINRYLRDVGGTERATLALAVQQGTIAAYASVVDNITGDPIFLYALEHQ